MEFALLGGGRLVFFHFLEQLLDAQRALFGKIEREVKFRQAAHLQTLDELVANITGRMFERFDGAIPFLGIAGTHNDKYARVLHVRLNANFAHADVAFEARIFQLAGKHGVNFVGDLLADSFVTMTRGAHFDLTSLGQTISMAWLISMEPRISSASSNAFCNTSRTCFSSVESVTTPTTERCQTS